MNSDEHVDDTGMGGEALLEGAEADDRALDEEANVDDDERVQVQIPVAYCDADEVEDVDLVSELNDDADEKNS